jgi:hypothetical protein
MTQPFVGDAVHDHSLLHSKYNIKAAIVEAVQSPGHLHKGTTSILKKATRKVHMTRDEQECSKRHLLHLKSQGTQDQLQNGSNGQNWTDLYTEMEFYKRREHL